LRTRAQLNAEVPPAQQLIMYEHVLDLMKSEWSLDYAAGKIQHQIDVLELVSDPENAKVVRG
jgi:hypothetical protein